MLSLALLHEPSIITGLQLPPCFTHNCLFSDVSKSWLITLWLFWFTFMYKYQTRGNKWNHQWLACNWLVISKVLTSVNKNPGAARSQTAWNKNRIVRNRKRFFCVKNYRAILRSDVCRTTCTTSCTVTSCSRGMASSKTSSPVLHSWRGSSQMQPEQRQA